MKAAENNEQQKFQPHEDIGIEFSPHDLIYSLEQKGHNTALHTAKLYYTANVCRDLQGRCILKKTAME